MSYLFKPQFNILCAARARYILSCEQMPGNAQG